MSPADADRRGAPRVLRAGRHRLPLGAKTYVMGILNCTPDSFAGDGFAGRPREAIEAGLRMVDEGADVLDIGGESTRPGSEAVGPAEELQRVIPVIEGLAHRTPAPLSVDTWKAEVARTALKAGASIVNDISGLHFDREMAETAALAGAAVVVMHIKGKPRTMQENPQYGDLLAEVKTYLMEGITKARKAGLGDDQIVLDPGIGFGKRPEHNLELLRRLVDIVSLGFPVLVGPSRKTFIGHLLDQPVEQRLEGTLAAVAVAIAHGADFVRVHDVAAAHRVRVVADAIVRGAPRP